MHTNSHTNSMRATGSALPAGRSGRSGPAGGAVVPAGTAHSRKQAALSAQRHPRGGGPAADPAACHGGQTAKPAPARPSAKPHEFAFTACENTVTHGKILATTEGSFEECARSCSLNSSCASFEHADHPDHPKKASPAPAASAAPHNRRAGVCTLRRAASLEASKGHTTYVRGKGLSCDTSSNVYNREPGIILGDTVGEIDSVDIKQCMAMCELDAQNCGAFVVEKQKCVLKRAQQSYYLEPSTHSVSYVNRNSKVQPISTHCQDACDKHEDDDSFFTCVKQCASSPASGGGGSGGGGGGAGGGHTSVIHGYTEHRNTEIVNANKVGYLDSVGANICARACNIDPDCGAFELERCSAGSSTCECTLLDHQNPFETTRKSGTTAYVPVSAHAVPRRQPQIYTPSPQRHHHHHQGGGGGTCGGLVGALPGQ